MDITVDRQLIRGKGLVPRPLTPYEGDRVIREYCTPKFPNYESIVARLRYPPLIANSIDTTTQAGEEQIKSILYNQYEGENIDITPSCSCGVLRGGSNLGVRCTICSTEVTNALQDTVEASLWIQNLDGIHKFVATGWWVVFSNFFTSKDWSLLEWIVSPDVPDPKPNHRAYRIAVDLDLNPEQRNLNFFYENFVEIMDRIATSMIIKKKPRKVKGLSDSEVGALFKALKDGEIDVYHLMLKTPIGDKLSDEKSIISFIHRYRSQPEVVFTRYLPMLSSAAMILEKNATGVYYDEVTSNVVNAMYAITNSGRSIQEKSLKYKNRKMVECIKNMAKFSHDYLRLRAMGKKGELRSHVFGGRQPFSMRCVIGPTVGGEDHEALILPWAPSVQTFRELITNKLSRMPRHPEFGAWTPRTINNFIDAYTNRYHPIIDSIFEQLLTESKNGIAVLFNRPPSLEKGSVKEQFVTGFSKDPKEKLIRMSTDTTATSNADAIIGS